MTFITYNSTRYRRFQNVITDEPKVYEVRYITHILTSNVVFGVRHPLYRARSEHSLNRV
jgi:hypothetical protein